MRTVTLWTATIAVASALAAGAIATEGGGGAYPNGAEGWMTGALPPPGDYLIDYNLYYRADQLMDDDGNAVPIDFDLEVFGTVLRYVHVTDQQILGATWAQHIFLPFLNVDVSTPAGRDETFGLGDIVFDPIILGWHKPPFHWAVGVDMYIPTGRYEEDAMANVGRNYWTFEPVATTSYANQKGLEISGKFMYDINLENKATGYESGDEFHFDYSLTQRVHENWLVGVSGSYYNQLEDDEQDGATVEDNKGEQLAWGPLVAYNKGPIAVILKYQEETETKNRPEGEKVWLKLICPL